jgi:hypothetical protein
MSAKTCVAELLDHQLVPKAGEAERPSLLRKWLRKPVSWQAGNNDAERVGRFAAMRSRIREQRNEFEEADE